MRLRKRKPYRFEAGGATFLVERALGSIAARDAIARAINPNGSIDTTAVLTAFVSGWEGVTDEDGEPAAFKPELLGRLPADVAGALADQIIEKHREEAERTDAVLGESTTGGASAADGGTGGA